MQDIFIKTKDGKLAKAEPVEVDFDLLNNEEERLNTTIVQSLTRLAEIKAIKAKAKELDIDVPVQAASDEAVQNAVQVETLLAKSDLNVLKVGK